MKKLREKKILVLSILCENLKNPQPQVVSIDQIADTLQLSIIETRQLLLKMDEAGEIQSDMEGRYSLITPAGLCWLSSIQEGART